MSEPPKPLFLEDMHPGQRFTAGPSLVTEEAMIAFARTFDPQPFHMDPETAADTLFQGLVASGWYTMAMTMRLLVDGALPFAKGVIGLGAEISWPMPVRPLDELTAESEIVAIAASRSKPDRAIVTVRTVTRNQRGETVQTLLSRVIAFRRSP
jgi:acyl dehydratase